jgi:hypothetical protein
MTGTGIALVFAASFEGRSIYQKQGQIGLDCEIGASLASVARDHVAGFEQTFTTGNRFHRLKFSDNMVKKCQMETSCTLKTRYVGPSCLRAPIPATYLTFKGSPKRGWYHGTVF